MQLKIATGIREGQDPHLKIYISSNTITMKKTDIYIHPTADVSPRAKLGRNVKIWHQAQVRENAVIGNNCIIGKGVYIDRGVKIGKNVKIQNYASIYFKSIIEDGVFIGPYACLTNDVYPRAIDKKGKLLKDNQWRRGKIVVQRGASIGAGAIILPDITVGKNSLVGAGSVVTKNVSPNSTVAGVPARIIPS